MVQYNVEQGVAILRLQSPPVNALSKVLLDALHVNVAKAHSDTKAKAIVIISNIPKFFVAGADISEIKKRQATEDGESMHYFTILTCVESFVAFLESNNSFLNLLENGPKPAVAALDGFALGGGLELAMSCNARISTHASKVGLPELTLGLIPGFGGTQRLPRLIGAKRALEMMLVRYSPHKR